MNQTDALLMELLADDATVAYYLPLQTAAEWNALGDALETRGHKVFWLDPGDPLRDGLDLQNAIVRCVGMAPVNGVWNALEDNLRTLPKDIPGYVLVIRDGHLIAEDDVQTLTDICEAVDDLWHERNEHSRLRLIMAGIQTHHGS